MPGTATPSTVTEGGVGQNSSNPAAAHSRRSASLSPKNGGGSMSEHSFPTANTSTACFSEIVHDRVVVRLIVEAENQTRPVCPTLQFAPVSSSAGLMGTGISKSHLDHRACHSP